jgi:hypothetical protein
VDGGAEGRVGATAACVFPFASCGAEMLRGLHASLSAAVSTEPDEQAVAPGRIVADPVGVPGVDAARVCAEIAIEPHVERLDGGQTVLRQGHAHESVARATRLGEDAEGVGGAFLCQVRVDAGQCRRGLSAVEPQPHVRAQHRLVEGEHPRVVGTVDEIEPRDGAAVHDQRLDAREAVRGWRLIHTRHVSSIWSRFSSCPKKPRGSLTLGWVAGLTLAANVRPPPSVVMSQYPQLSRQRNVEPRLFSLRMLNAKEVEDSQPYPAYSQVSDRAPGRLPRFTCTSHPTARRKLHSD